MNVSNLSDVELNRAMIWLNPELNDFIHKDTGRLVFTTPNAKLYNKWSYLANWNLTMPLAVDNNLNIFMPLNKGDAKVLNPYISKLRAYNKNPLRAICEVLVMIALERKS